MSNLTQALNKQLANFSVLYVKLHNYHWNVKGPQFFTLHAKFEELYNETALHVDEIAERILTIGGEPMATMKDYLGTASIQEGCSSQSAEQMVQSIVSDFQTILSELKSGMETAEEANDETSADMLLAIYTGLEKHVWMLNSFLR
jgi:starvation-inducible DNA-binding protein